MSQHGAARRRLAKAGVGAAGILMTLEGKATMHYGPVCRSPSGSLSGNLSSTTAPKPTCNARGPEYWCKVSHFWPCSSNIKFGDVFRCKGGNYDNYANIKLVDILGKDKYSRFVGRDMAATYLNILSGKISFMDEVTLKRMWNDLQSKGVYSPVAKTFWTPEQVRRYLMSTYRG